MAAGSPCVHATPPEGAAGTAGAAPSPLSAGEPAASIGARDIIWLRADGGEMLQADWHDPNLHALGLILHGAALNETGPRGEPVMGDTLALLLNADVYDTTFHLRGHDHHACTQWITLVEHKRAAGQRGLRMGSGPGIEVPARSLLLLAESP